MGRMFWSRSIIDLTVEPDLGNNARQQLVDVGADDGWSLNIFEAELNC